MKIEDKKQEYFRTKCAPVDNGLIIANTSFTTGSGKDIQFLDDKTVQLRVEADPVNDEHTKGYNYYFHIALTNNSKEKIKIILEALRPDTISSEKKWFKSKAPILCSNDGTSWYLLPEVEATGGHLDYRCLVTLEAEETVQVANNIPIAPDHVTSNLKSIFQKNLEITKYHEIGKSVQGFPIPLLEINNNNIENKDHFLIWAGIHPSEPDPLAAFWVIEWLLSNEKKAIQARNSYVFDIIPMINPDGFTLGTSGCNANGINIFWDFRFSDSENCPEATALWEWIQKRPPQVSIDLHSYIYQVEKQARPYICSMQVYPPKFRKVAWAMQEAVVKLCNGEAADGQMAVHKTCLAPHLIKKYGTLTLPGYHLHLADGPNLCRKRMIETLNVILDGTYPYQPLNALKVNWVFIDFGAYAWRIIELLYDRIPRRIRVYLGLHKKKRPVIDKSEEWLEHNYNLLKRKPVAIVSSKQML